MKNTKALITPQNIELKGILIPLRTDGGECTHRFYTKTICNQIITTNCNLVHKGDNYKILEVSDYGKVKVLLLKEG